jgi:hypothetical protein
MSLTKVTYAMIDGASVNVLDYGAVGDGVTDDTAAIQAAIDYAKSEPNGVIPSVYLPAGIYKITAPLEINDVRGLRVHGDGRGRPVSQNISDSQGATTIFYDGVAGTGTDPNILNVTAAFELGSGNTVRGCVFHDFSIWCGDKCNGFRLYLANTCTFRNIYILNPIIGVYAETSCFSNLWEAVEVSTPSIGHFDLRASCHSNLLTKCTFNNPSNSTTTPDFCVRIAIIDNCSEVSLVGCNFDSYFTEKIIRVAEHTTGTKDCLGFSMFGNYIEIRNDGATTHCVSLEGGYGIAISGNRFTCETSAPVLYGISCIPAATTTVDGVSVTGNFFENFSTAAIRVNADTENVWAAGNSLNNVPELFTDVNTQTTSGGFDEGVLSVPSLKKLALGSAVKYTIASGAITIGDTSYIKVDTEGGAATDDLDTINGATSDGQILVIQDFDATHDVTVKDGTGNLQLASDFTILNGRSKLTLIWNALNNNWEEIARSSN